MPLASGIRVGLRYVAEVTRGTTPASPTMKKLRANTRNLNDNREVLRPNEVRSDRMKADVRHGFRSNDGQVGFDFAAQDFDDWLSAAMGSSFAAASTAATTLGTTAPDQITRSTGSFWNDGYVPGMTITLAGSATQDGDFTIEAISADGQSITTVETSISTEAGSGDETLVEKTTTGVLKIGTTLSTFTVERAFEDVTQYQVFRGVAINQMTFNIQPRQVIGGTFDLLGMTSGGFSATPLDATPTEPANEDVMSAFDGSIVLNDTAIAVCTGLTFTLNNNRTVEAVVGATGSPDVFEGEAMVTGRMSLFFEDAVEYNLFHNESEPALVATLTSLDGTDNYVINFPRIKVLTGAIDPPQTGPIVQEMDFEAVLDTGSGTSLMISRFLGS